MADKNTAESIVALAERVNAPTKITGTDRREHLLIPEGYEAKDISDAYGIPLDPPRTAKEVRVLQTKDSLVEYTNRFKLDGTLLIADIEQNSIFARIDYHNASNGKEAGATDYGLHTAKLALPFSEEWKTWTSVSGVLKGQLEFARFIEENAPDIDTPEAAEVLEACRDLQARRKVSFTNAVRTESDNENFTYADEADLSRKGDLEVPTKFILAIPVYFGEGNVEVSAFLRWKIDDGKLSLGIKLHRYEHVRQAVFKLIVEDIASRTKCPVIYGKP